MILFWGILYIIASYFLGAIPFGYYFTRIATKKNILKEGSGNIGSTNVRRIAGNQFAIYTQLLDMLKGFIPVAVLTFFSSINSAVSFTPYFFYLSAMASILGHDFSIFLKFKGGKGVNTTLGASVLLTPYAVFISVVVYFLFKKAFRFVSLGSIALSITLPIVEFIQNKASDTFIFLCLCSFLILLLHAENIKRLAKKQELKVNK